MHGVGLVAIGAAAKDCDFFCGESHPALRGVQERLNVILAKHGYKPIAVTGMMDPATTGGFVHFSTVVDAKAGSPEWNEQWNFVQGTCPGFYREDCKEVVAPQKAAAPGPAPAPADEAPKVSKAAVAGTIGGIALLAALAAYAMSR